MPSRPAMVVGPTARLRASCNACNESKVRCSQDKPTCARCERNETECIYGLSRRTHKDAPPISVPPSQRGRKQQRSGNGVRLTPNGGTSTNTGTDSNSPSTATSGSNGCTIPDEPVEAHNNKANLFHNYMFPAAPEPDTMHDTAPMLDFGNLVTGGVSSSALTPGYFSTTRDEYAHPTTRDLESLFGANQSDAMDIGTYRTPNSEGECTCHAGVMELLGMMRNVGSNSVVGGAVSSGNSTIGSNDWRPSVDSRLAKLKQCIASSETSMRCTHGRDDSEPMHIMAVAMLIGYAIDEFKLLASESSAQKSSPLSSSSSIASTSMSSTSGASTAVTADTAMLGGFMEPRLSWGVLELEEDDELDLRHRLYLLTFRKLERLLSQLPTFIQDMHSTLVSLPDPSRHMAFVIVCDYTRLWLEKKASDVKRLLSTSTRDELKDPRYG